MSVVEFPGAGDVAMARDPRSLDVSIEAVLDGAKDREGDLRAVIVCGLTNGGELFAASSSNSVADVILLLERIKAHLMSKFSGDTFA